MRNWTENTWCLPLTRTGNLPIWGIAIMSEAFPTMLYHTRPSLYSNSQYSWAWPSKSYRIVWSSQMLVKLDLVKHRLKSQLWPILHICWLGTFDPRICYSYCSRRLHFLSWTGFGPRSSERRRTSTVSRFLGADIVACTASATNFFHIIPDLLPGMCTELESFLLLYCGTWHLTWPNRSPNQEKLPVTKKRHF